MSAVQSTTLPWMLHILNMTKNQLKKLNPFDFFILLCAFLYGNIFTIQCSKLDWGFLLIFGVVVFIEILDKFFYSCFHKNQQKNHKTKDFVKAKLVQFKAGSILNTFLLLNTFKRGFFLGFFLEAFKVGS